MFYINIENGKINGGSGIDNSRFWSENYFQLEVSEDIYNSVMCEPEKYIYSGGAIIKNPDYDDSQAERLRTEQITQIKSQLNELDLRSIRALRANEATYLEEYELQAVALRQQLKELGVR